MSQGFDQRVGFSDGLHQSVREIVRDGILEAHTTLPGEIVTFDPDTQTATVRLCIQRETLGENQTIADLPSVPVMIQSGGGFSATFPVATGDPCLVVFIERGIGNWYINGGVQPPETRRHHHLSDAICIPGLRPAPDALPNYDPDNFTVRSDDGQTQLCITPNGEFALTNGTEEVLTLVRELIQTLSAATDVAGQAFAPATVTALNNIETRLATLIK